ncbi:MAG TPA: hypothetical protein VNS58_06200 [Puia sp.]|nr:hypothetical protein [Puia sp.]
MSSRLSKKKIYRIYPAFLPLLTALLGFGIGHISYTIYLPVWIVHSCLIGAAVWVLGAHHLKSTEAEKKQAVIVTLLLILPWMFFSIFFGMGPPPATAAGWVTYGTEQQVRYSILTIGGISVTAGFVLLREKLKSTGEGFYSLLGVTAILIAIPLFVMNMTFWGSYLPEASKIFAAAPAARRPDWFLPIREHFGTISTTEINLTYLATAAFAASLKAAGWFKPAACRIYIIISFIGVVFNSLPYTVPEPWATIGYLVSVPAIPFIMPYLMGLNLLRRLGD